MHSPQILLLALGPLLVGASVIRRANDAYSFTIFQTTDCSNTQGNFTVEGKTDNFPTCSPPLEYFFGSIIVNADADARCSISFYNQTIAGDQCRGAVSTEPGNMQIGQCFQFEPKNHPITYGVVCG
jgi:hypothetical protein